MNKDLNRETSFILKGNIVYTKQKDQFEVLDGGYLVCEDQKVAGVFTTIPEKYKGFILKDCKDQLIIPGLADLHIHAPQYTYRGLGMDLELLPWLDTYAFPEESKYADLVYAKKAYSIFTKHLSRSVTTRAVIFSSLHVKATELLMELLNDQGMAAMVGKVNMDQNSPESLIEDTHQSAVDTEKWILDTMNRYENIKPIITPRFVPSCSSSLLQELGILSKKYNVPVQSHLSENVGEIQWVSELEPKAAYYGDAYDRYGLMGGENGNAPVIMAHCVYSSKEEMELMKKNGVFVAHCPQSNMNVSSGMAPIRTMLDMGLKVGLGSDIAGGSHICMFRAITDAIQVSKLRFACINREEKPLALSEAFFMATKGGGDFFGKVGSFEQGYEFDAVVLDDTSLEHTDLLNTLQRLEKIIYLSDDRNVTNKYIKGKKII